VQEDEPGRALRATLPRLQPERPRIAWAPRQLLRNARLGGGGF
jgi:hypothetical protein